MKLLSGYHKHVGFNSHTHIKMGAEAHLYYPSVSIATWEVEIGGSWEACGPASLSYSVAK